MRTILILMVVFSGLSNGASWAKGNSGLSSKEGIDLTLIPPSPVTDKINLDIRGAVRNYTNRTATYDVGVYLDALKPADRLYQETLTVSSKSAGEVRFLWPTRKQAGHHRIFLVARSGQNAVHISQPITVIPSEIRSTGRIGGAWVGIAHWSETEGRHWNDQIKKMTDEQWEQLVRGMHGIGMNIIVIQEVFRNQVYNNEDSIILQKGYQGRAYYPSKLYPGRMPIAAKDPIKAILTEADQLGMHVFLGVGDYAWFDYSPASLAWHKRVAKELWQLYGNHPSFYGWYISEEKDGGLGDATERKQIVDFFKDFTPYVHALAPGKPVMLATNCYHLRGAEDTYLRLLPNLDILCPFAFARMPEGDETGAQAAALLDSLCRVSGTHLWLDMEVFVFDKEGGLVPRPIAGIMSDLHQYTSFEETICYQYPGLLTAPDASIKLGGESAVKLYLDYQKYIKTLPK